MSNMAAQCSSSFWFFRTGDAKSEDTANKEAGEEKPEEDNDYHRSDEQVSPHLLMESRKSHQMHAERYSFIVLHTLKVFFQSPSYSE